MAYDQHDDYPQRSYRATRDRLARQQSEYRSPYAETVSDAPSERRPSSARYAPRSPNTDLYRTLTASAAPSSRLTRQHPRAPPPASHRSDIGTNSYMDYDTAMLDAYDNVSIHSSISQRASRRSQRPASQASQPPRQLQDVPPEDYYRQHQEPPRLYPSAVRAARTFAYEMEPVSRDREERLNRRVFSYQRQSSPSSPQLQARPDTYQEIPPSHYGTVLSRPGDYQDHPQPGPPPRNHPNGDREALSRAFLYDPNRSYTPPADSVDSASSYARSRAESSTSRLPEYTNAPGSARPSSSRAHSSRSHSSRSSADLRQYRDRGGQVLEVLTPGGTTIRVVEDRSLN